MTVSELSQNTAYFCRYRSYIDKVLSDVLSLE